MTDFVISGGASPLGASELTDALSGFSSGQKVWLATLALIFSPVLLLAVPFFVPIAIVWMILRYNLKKRSLAAPAAVHPGNFQQPQLQPAPTNLLHESRLLAQQPVAANRLIISDAAPGSVVEDDTRRLQNQ